MSVIWEREASPPPTGPGRVRAKLARLGGQPGVRDGLRAAGVLSAAVAALGLVWAARAGEAGEAGEAGAPALLARLRLVGPPLLAVAAAYAVAFPLAAYVHERGRRLRRGFWGSVLVYGVVGAVLYGVTGLAVPLFRPDIPYRAVPLIGLALGALWGLGGGLWWALRRLRSRITGSA